MSLDQVRDVNIVSHTRAIPCRVVCAQDGQVLPLPPRGIKARARDPTVLPTEGRVGGFTQTTLSTQSDTEVKARFNTQKFTVGVAANDVKVAQDSRARGGIAGLGGYDGVLGIQLALAIRADRTLGGGFGNGHAAGVTIAVTAQKVRLEK